MSVKQEVMKTLANLPEDATAEDIEYHVYVALLLHERLASADRSKNLTIEEIRQRMRLWDE